VGRQLVGGIEAGPATLAETDLTSTHGHHRITVWPCESEYCVVLVAVDVEMVRRSAVGVGVSHHVGFQTFGQPAVVRGKTRTGR
jgi:hypothetical protein